MSLVRINIVKTCVLLDRSLTEDFHSLAKFKVQLFLYNTYLLIILLHGIRKLWKFRMKKKTECPSLLLQALMKFTREAIECMNYITWFKGLLLLSDRFITRLIILLIEYPVFIIIYLMNLKDFNVIPFFKIRYLRVV